ncbi:excisionase family DNA-binding protein [Bradyrhizobium sp. SZCCHNS1012]|uniref:excisionase family DNA-binding protein n=1 Tax=Bradyrhizobium sp. SZCCHNS1012 TaxID=3057297 RepID=UPI0029166C7F|nr:excisionase family DNA-binding protein [Bradyrhizobium sp. SZCCHNS1012]
MTKKIDERLAYSPLQAAELIGFSRSGFYLLLASGEIPSVKVGRKRLIRRADLLAWLKRLPLSTPQDDEED